MKVFNLPDLGEGLAEAEIREWYVKEGETVSVDQPLVSMETAKAVVDVPSPYAGKILKLHGDINAVIKTGSPLITFESDEMTQEKKTSVVGALEETAHTWKEEPLIIGSASTKTKTIKAMPQARVLAQQFNIDLSLVTPSGPQGLITVQDVKQWFEHSEKRTGSALTGETEKLHGVRRVMAVAMAQSHREVVPVTIFEEADISHLSKESDLTVILLKAIVFATKSEPALNAWFDGLTLERKLFSEVNVGLAVDTSEGLFVPVIKQVEKLSTEALRDKINEYKTTVKDRSVSPREMQGATITLSNFGMIAGKYATPIIIPPSVAILGCGRHREMAISRDGNILSARLLPLSLTFDHRAVTGGEATRFLGALMSAIQA